MLSPLYNYSLASLLTLAAIALHQGAHVVDAETVGPEIVTTAQIQAYADRARSRNPGVKAREAEAAAVRHAASSIKTWEDPMLKLSGTQSSSDGPILREDGDLGYGLEQKLPLFGKARARIAAAEQEWKSADLAVEYQVQILRREIAKALFRVALESERIGLVSDDIGQLDLWLAIAERRHAAGTGGQIELLRLRTERSKARELLTTRQAELSHEEATLNGLLSQDVETQLPRYALPPISQALPYSRALADLAVRFEPKLRIMHQQTAAAEARVEMARRERLPEVSVGIDGRQYSRDGGFREGTFTVGLTLPWLNRQRYRHDILRARSDVEATRFDTADYQLKVREEIHLLCVKIDTARREALLYQDEILPRAEAMIGSASGTWSAGLNSFNDLIEGRRLRTEARLMRTQAVGEQYQMLAELVLCCGLADLDALDMFRAGTQGSAATSPLTPKSTNSPKP